MNKTRVFIADDHPILRSGLRLLIDAQPDLEVAGEAWSVHELLRTAPEAAPDVVSLDLDMKGASGLAAIMPLKSALPQVKIVVLSGHGDSAYVQAAFAAGAHGYVVKSAADTKWLAAIRAVHRNRMVVETGDTPDDQEAPRRPAAALEAAAARSAAPSPLTQREQEVLLALARGYTNAQAADQLFLSVKTVETYRARIGQKLGLKDRAALVRYAIELGLLNPADSQPSPE